LRPVEVFVKVHGRETTLGGAASRFPQTQWGLVTQARDSTPEVRRAGLEELCRRYWKPVYIYLRRAGAKSVEDAKDLTQAFFLWLTESEVLDRYTKEKASFRTFLKVLLRHFAEHRDRALHRLKRGGGVKILDLDRETLPLKDVLADPRTADPEQEFERTWLNELVARAVKRVRRQLSSQGREIQFRVFEEYDLSGDPEGSYDDLAARLGLTKSDVRNYLSAVRLLLREEIRDEMRQTTSSPEEFEEEWNALFGP
jgi:RNA polymerase sigma factor (sigma-70 family)